MRYTSLATASEVRCDQPVAEVAVHGAVLEVFGEGLYETSLLPMYANDDARHMCVELKLDYLHE